MKTPLSPPDAAFRRYQIAHACFLSAFTVAMLFTKIVLPRVTLAWERWLFVIVPAVLLALWAWEFARMIRTSDERQQYLHLRALAFGFGLVLVAATLWDVVARFQGEPRPPVFLILPA